MEDAVQTVMTQCELWTDNNDMGEENVINFHRNQHHMLNQIMQSP